MEDSIIDPFNTRAKRAALAYAESLDGETYVNIGRRFNINAQRARCVVMWMQYQLELRAYVLRKEVLFDPDLTIGQLRKNKRFWLDALKEFKEAGFPQCSSAAVSAFAEVRAEAVTNKYKAKRSSCGG